MKGVSGSFVNYEFTDEDRAKSRHPEAIARAVEARQRRAIDRWHFAIQHRIYGWTTGRIAAELGVTEGQVDRYLRGTPYARQYGRGYITRRPKLADGERLGQ